MFSLSIVELGKGCKGGKESFLGINGKTCEWKFKTCLVVMMFSKSIILANWLLDITGLDFKTGKGTLIICVMGSWSKSVSVKGPGTLLHRT